MSRRILLTVTLLALLGGAAYYYRSHPASAEGAAKRPPDAAGVPAKGAGGQAAKGGAGRAAGPIPVVTAPVVRRDLPVEISVVGRAEAPQTVPIRARVDGVIESVGFTAGQHVRKGQLLVALDARQIEAQLRQAQGNLARDQANLAKAKADLARYSDLAARNFVAASALDGFRAAVQAAEATVAFDQAAVDFARVQLEHTRIRAPMDGVAGALMVFPGGNVKANDTVIVTVNQLQPILVAFPVPEAQLAGVRELMAKGPVPVRARAKDNPNAAREGRLAFVDNAVDATTGTILLKARFENADDSWTPGQFVNVSLVSRVIRDAVTAPIEAVQMGPSGNIAFVVRDGKAEVRPVRAFSAAGPYAVLEGGFEPGERLVVDGQLRLTAGASVREQSAGKTGAGKGGAGDDSAAKAGAPGRDGAAAPRATKDPS